MPQPLSKVCPNGAAVFLGNPDDRLFNQCKDVGLLAMEAIASCCTAETFLLKLYLDLMGGKKQLAAVSYLSLESQSAKTAIIKAVAKAVLTGYEVSLLNEIIKFNASIQKSRNKLVHWTWGYSPSVPNAYLLEDPRYSKDASDVSNYDELKEYLIEAQKNIYVWYDVDFKKVINDNSALCRYCHTFSLGLTIRSSGQISSDFERLYDQLVPEKVKQADLANQSSL